MSLRDDINIPLVVVLGLTTGLIVAVAIIGTQAGYNYATQSELARNYDEAEKAGRLRFGEKVWAPQREALAKPASWASADKGSVRIPLQSAKELMLSSKGNPPALPVANTPANAGGGNGGGSNAPTSQPAHR